MAREEKHREKRYHLSLLQSFAHPGVWLLCLIYSTVAMGSNSFGFYAPKLIADHFTGLSKLQIGLLSALPGVAAIIGMLTVGVHSDRTGERRWHVAVPAFVAASGWVVVALAEQPPLALAGLVLAQMGMLSMLPTFWTLPTSFLSGAAAAGGIAFINSVGNLGGFVGPYVISQFKTITGSFSGGLLFLAGSLVLGGLLVLCARHDTSLEKPGDDRSAKSEERPTTLDPGNKGEIRNATWDIARDNRAGG
jgi:predicted MFS family arabinose efflux permease